MTKIYYILSFWSVFVFVSSHSNVTTKEKLYITSELVNLVAKNPTPTYDELTAIVDYPESFSQHRLIIELAYNLFKDIAMGYFWGNTCGQRSYKTVKEITEVLKQLPLHVFGDALLYSAVYYGKLEYLTIFLYHHHPQAETLHHLQQLNELRLCETSYNAGLRWFIRFKLQAQLLHV